MSDIVGRLREKAEDCRIDQVDATWIKDLTEAADRLVRIEQLERENAELRDELASGYWTASVSDCAPPRSKRDSPLKNSRVIRLNGSFSTESEALKVAEAAIAHGWANGTTIIHRETAAPRASFNLSREAIDALGRARRLAEQEGTV